MVAQTNLFAMLHLLGTTDEHQWREIDGTPTKENNQKDCTPEEQEHNPFNEFPDFTNNCQLSINYPLSENYCRVPASAALIMASLA